MNYLADAAGNELHGVKINVGTKFYLKIIHALIRISAGLTILPYTDMVLGSFFHFSDLSETTISIGLNK